MDATTGQGPKVWLSVKEAADYLGLSRGSVYELVKVRKLGCHRLGLNGGRLKFTREDLDAYAAKSRTGPKVVAVPPPAPRRAPYIAKYPLG